MSLEEVRSARMSIGEAALLTRLSNRAIRLYESQGLLQPARGANGNRLFSGRDVERLQVIAMARRMGVTLKEVARVIETFERCGPNAAVAALKGACEARLQQLEEQQHELRAFLIRRASPARNAGDV
ncbi:MAG TPA: MerR family transcriptional regulator [Caulobacteraceae bacterium]|nr:MerR family transcriptional regulator [Caulobacteraceae bacterium]